MPLQVYKKAIRCLGISESFIKGVSEKSILAGVVMRSDLIVDGFTFSTTIVGGMDSTEKILEMYRNLNREDINFLLLNGCVISWYNIIDLNKLAKETSLPLICITYDKSEGLEKYFEELFPKDKEERIRIYNNNGPRSLLSLFTGYNVYVRFFNTNVNDVKKILTKFTKNGAIPEPLRLARILARSIMKNPAFSQK